MKMIKKISVVAISLFALITFYDLLFNGWFESSSTEVGWYYCGAGSYTLLTRFVLVPISVLLSIIMIFQKQPIINRAAWLCAVLIIPVVFAYSADGIERYSKSYDEEIFQQVVHEISEGEQHTQSSVRALLGKPLSMDKKGSVWSYTYMPSCGFGWTKRTIEFDEEEKAIGYDNYSEP
jgi:uncharacterized membrane protein